MEGQGHLGRGLSGVRPEGIDPEGQAGRRLVAVADVLTSSTALLELHDKAGVPVEDAAEWVAWALDVLHRATRREEKRADTREAQR